MLGGELRATELGQLGHKRPGQNGTHPRRAAQERLVLAPGGALSDRPVEVGVGAGEFLLEPLCVRLDTLLDGPTGRRPEAVLLGGHHLLDDLPTPGEDRGELPSLFVGQGLGLRAEGLGEASEHLGVVRSVLASLPVARAKSRAWRGSTIATGIAAAAKAAATARSKPPVASKTTSCLGRAPASLSRPRSVPMPAGSLGRAKCSPVGRKDASGRLLGTSIPA